MNDVLRAAFEDGVYEAHMASVNRGSSNQLPRDLMFLRNPTGGYAQQPTQAFWLGFMLATERAATLCKTRQVSHPVGGQAHLVPWDDTFGGRHEGMTYARYIEGEQT